MRVSVYILILYIAKDFIHTYIYLCLAVYDNLSNHSCIAVLHSLLGSHNWQPPFSNHPPENEDGDDDNTGDPPLINECATVLRHMRCHQLHRQCQTCNPLGNNSNNNKHKLYVPAHFSSESPVTTHHHHHNHHPPRQGGGAAAPQTHFRF